MVKNILLNSKNNNVKLFNMKKSTPYFIKALIIILLIINNQFVFSQSSTDLMKYWYYRNRLKYFVINGNKQGEGQIACIRNRIDEDTGSVAGKMLIMGRQVTRWFIYGRFGNRVLFAK